MLRFYNFADIDHVAGNVNGELAGAGNPAKVVLEEDLDSLLANLIVVSVLLAVGVLDAIVGVVTIWVVDEVEVGFGFEFTTGDRTDIPKNVCSVLPEGVTTHYVLVDRNAGIATCPLADKDEQLVFDVSCERNVVDRCERRIIEGCL